MSDALPYSHPLRPADLAARRPLAVDLMPDAAAMAAIAADLGLIGLRKLRLKGQMIPQGRTDWRLQAELGATVVQPCVVTLDPVTTRIDEPVLRRWLADWTPPQGDEVEMPEDDTTEPLTAVIDLGAVLVEALALALPLYPRAPGAELGSLVAAEPGVVPLTDQDVKPFAGLAALKNRLTAPGAEPAAGDDDEADDAEDGSAGGTGGCDGGGDGGGSDGGSD
ncbi:MAG: DUF177 domain-containing protein [Rhodobacterales bacterium]|nr:DUF177 domain-containing protein [Rhodobacterales bacterium]